MPSQQPNENMDKALKAYAQKRRDDAAQMELDLATRNMLQAEVARTLAPVPVLAKARPRFAWWPQIIMGVAGCAAVAIALILWSPSQGPSKVRPGAVANEFKSSAQVTTAAPHEDTPSSQAPATAAAPSPDPAFAVSASGTAKLATPKQQETPYAWAQSDADKKSAPSSLGILTDNGGVASAGRLEADVREKHEIAKDSSVVITNGGSVTDSLSFFDSATTPGFSAAREPAPVLAKSFDSTVPATTSAPTSAPVLKVQPENLVDAERSRAGGGRDVAGKMIANNARQQLPQANLRFLRIDNSGQYRRNINSPPLPKVLTNFAVRRNGSNVSVRDADGSLYNGNIIQDAAVAALNATVNAAGYGGAMPASQNGENMPEDTFAFRVSGFNGKLKQKIVFTGNVTNVLVVSNVTAVGYVQQQAGERQNVNAPQQQSAQQNLLLNGRVQVGRNTEFEIQAAPTK